MTKCSLFSLLRVVLSRQSLCSVRPALPKWHWRHLWLIGIVLLGVPAPGVKAASTVTIPINPLATYLVTSPLDTGAVRAVPISLATLNIHPGDTIVLTALGDVSFCFPSGCPEVPIPLAGLFSTTNLPSGAITAGGNPIPFVTPPTLFDNIPTDIPQDFFISHAPSFNAVTVPAGAQFLFVIMVDNFYGDNADPNHDLAVSITAPTLAYVTDFGGAVSVIDTTTNTVVATVPVAGNPSGVALTPDGASAYVGNLGSSAVTVVDTSTNTVSATVTVGTHPVGIAFTPDGAFAFVANRDSNNVSVIATATKSVTATIPVGVNPVGVAITPNGTFAYVVNSVSGTVSVIATATNAVVATIDIGGFPIGVAITPDSAFAYVGNSGSNTVAVIDTASNTVAATVIAGTGPAGVTITLDGTLAYVTNNSSNDVSVIDTASNTVVATVALGAGTRPLGIAITPDEAFVYVANTFDGVSVIDTATNTLVATLTAGAGPQWVAFTPGSVLKITPPPSVRLNALENNQNAFFFAERVSFVLPSAIAVDASSPGTYNSVGSLTPGIIPAGTVVDSFFLHADPFDPNNGVFYSGTLTFPNPILGVVALSASLDHTDAILGAPGTLYPAPGSERARGFELGFPDMLVISPDGKTLTFSDAVGGASDQLRIVTAATPPQPVAPGTSTTFTSPNVINQTVTIPPDANMNGTATMRVSFIQVAPAVFNASIAAGTNGNAFSGGKPVPPGTTCTPINSAGGNCIITENKCFDANGAAFALCPITATTTPIQLTSQYETTSPQPNPALMIASDGQSNYAVITTGFNATDVTISGGTKALNSDEVIGNLPGAPPSDTVPPTTTASTSPFAPNGANGWFTTSPVSVILASTDDTLVKQITYSASGAQPIASTTVLGASTFFQIANQGATTISYQATDQAGNVEAVKTLTVKIDTTPPSINITSPTNGATYTLNQAVAASYTCTDPESSPAPSCTGPVASGSNIDTASVGGKSFTVNSTDAAGLSSTQSVSYSVSYNICILYDPSHAVVSGSTIPLRMYLCDASGKDVSSSGVIVHATKLIQVSTQASDTIVTAGNANPDNDFRFDSTLGPAGGYIFNLQAKLPAGVYHLFFTAGSDPSTTHFLTFQVN